MKTAIRFGLAAGLAGALALLGSAQAQQGTSSGSGGSGKGSSDMTTGGGSSASSGSTASGAKSAGPKIDQKLHDQLERIHAANQAQVQFAQLGATNAQSPDVKELAQKMETDHQKLDKKITQQAQTMGVTLEGKTFAKQQEAASKDLKKLQSKTGKDFDKEYMSRVVKAHESELKDVKDATKGAQKANQTELASLLQTAQTGMQGHLDHAKQVQKGLESGQQRQGTGSGSTTMPGGGEKSAPSGTGTKSK